MHPQVTAQKPVTNWSWLRNFLGRVIHNYPLKNFDIIQNILSYQKYSQKHCEPLRTLVHHCTWYSMFPKSSFCSQELCDEWCIVLGLKGDRDGHLGSLHEMSECDWVGSCKVCWIQVHSCARALLPPRLKTTPAVHSGVI